jgi:calcium/calmodulin-dependent protein kinase I
VGSKFYLVFPLCVGGELYEHIIKRGHFTEVDAADLTRQIVGGLHALHEHDILHLDIKPENILFDSNEPDAKIRITDFGLSKRQTKAEVAAFDQAKLNADMAQELRSFQLTGDLTNDRRMKGTIGYMSPELLLINHTSGAADIFAAGVVVYILLSGMPPYQGSNDRDTINKTIVGELAGTVMVVMCADCGCVWWL